MEPWMAYLFSFISLLMRRFINLFADLADPAANSNQQLHDPQHLPPHPPYTRIAPPPGMHATPSNAG